MKMLQLTSEPIAKVGMLIRRPPAEVFDSFVNPDVTTKFWFTGSSGSLEAGRHIQWDWEMYGIHVEVNVRIVEPGKRIVLDWGVANEKPTTVEWTLTPVDTNATYVTITNSGFEGDADAQVAQALDSVGGFTTVLDGAKAWLEHRVELNLIADKYPQGIAEH